MDRIDAMRAFITVVTEGSFTLAAERLALSPQLISKHIAQLEKHLSARLLNRTTRKLHLTEAGTRYFQRAQQVLSDISDMENELGDMQAHASGLLRISAPASFAIRHMAKLMIDFQQAHPAVDIDLQINDRKVDIVEEGFDIALRIGHLKSSSLIAKRIAPVRLVMCASPEYLQQHGMPKSLQDLKAHRYLRYSYLEDDANQLAHRWLRSSDRARSNELVCNNGDVLVESAIAGAGIALQPTFISGAAIKEGKLTIVLPEHEPEPLTLYAVYSSRQLLANKVKCFVEFLDGYYGDRPYWDQFD